MIRHVTAVFVGASLLTACAEDGSTNESILGGAALGAIGGAVIGAIIGNRKGALIGAGVGAVAGGAVGGILDQQQKELEKNLEGTGATVTNTGEELLVSLPNEVTFDFDSAEIQPRFFDPLAKVAETLVEYEASLIDVIGHTDSVGAERYNQELSQRRANAIAGFLRRRGVIEERIIALGRGETQPIATNEDETGRAQNRRVELKITPLTDDA